MTLEYKILWYEDEEGYVESKSLEIKEYLEEQGFVAIITSKDRSDNVDYDLLRNFDLLLVDYNLARGEHGSDLIQMIRSLKVYTEIIFYSQNDIVFLRDEIRKKNLDGVYCTGRDEFVDRVKDVIGLTLKKVIDLNNIRGLVLANTSEHDIVMNKIIDIALSRLGPEKMAYHVNKIKKVYFEHLDENKEKMNKIDLSQESMINLISSFHKWRAVRRLVSDFATLNKYSEELKDYDKEIIEKRNRLGHAQETINERGQKILRSYNNGSEFVFDDTLASEIRKDIIRYTKLFDKVLKDLQSED